MNFRTHLLLLTSWLAACAGACSPVQQFYMKEKVIEGAPRHGIITDKFLYGRAMGPVDALFVVDNSETGDAAGEAFQRSYTDFIGRIGSQDARLLDIRTQVVTTPKSKTPGNWAATQGANPAAQLAELFTAPDRILNYLARGKLNPLSATGIGLAHKAFENHGGAPLFLFFLMGHDFDPALDLASETKVFAELIGKGRGFHQTHLVLLSQITPPTAHTTPFPRCINFFPAPRAVAGLSALPWRSFTQVDLCQPSWADNLPSAAFSALVDYKKKLVLSRVPYQPSTMLLRSGTTRLFRFGDDYGLDSRTNEITFLRDPGLLEGDLLEASYYLPPTEEVLNNFPSPPINPPTPPAHGNGG